MTLTSSQQTEVGAQAYRRAEFVRIEFSAGEKNFTTHDHDVTFGGVTYIAGMMLAIDGAKATADRAPSRIILKLAGTDPALRAAIEGNIHFAKLTYSLAVLDANGAVIDSLISRVIARVSAPVIRISAGLITIELQAESETVLFLRPRRIIGSDADQRYRFAGDTGLDLVERVQGSEAEWGGQPQAKSGGTTGGGIANRENLF